MWPINLQECGVSLTWVAGVLVLLSAFMRRKATHAHRAHVYHKPIQWSSINNGDRGLVLWISHDPDPSTVCIRTLQSQITQMDHRVLVYEFWQCHL